MENGKIICREMMALHQRDGERIPQSQSGRRRARRSEPQAVCFFFDARIEHCVRIFSECRILFPDDRNELRSDALQGREDIQHLARFSAVRICDDHIIGCHHAKIPVNAFRRMQEKSRRPCARHGRCHFPRDMA